MRSPERCFERADASEHFRQLRSRNHAVLHVVVRRDAAHRGERRLAAFPDARALVVVAGNLDLGAAGAPADRFDELEEPVDLRLRAVELHDQHRFGLREIRMHSRFGRFDGEPVHHLDRGWNDAGRDDLGDRGARGFGRFERGENRLDRFGDAQNAQRHLRDDRQRAFRSNEHAQQIEARRIQRGPAEMHHLAVRQHGFDAEHVMDREPVFQAMRAARVLRDVAADRADQLARRIGRVVVAVRRDAPGDVEVDDAGLDGDALVREYRRR